MGRPKIRTDALRDAALRSARGELERHGPAAVTARGVALAAGTSTGALYELFGDKAGLVRAVYLDGFAALAATLAAVPTSDDATADLAALLAAARRFALDRPMLFELMHSRPFAEFSPGPDDVAAATAVYQRFVAAVRRWLGQSGSPASAREAAHVLVAAHRGFVTTELAGIVGGSRASVERRYRRGVEAILAGILATGADR